ncbi:unnamed protein product [Leuciscus chuanchicus]
MKPFFMLLLCCCFDHGVSGVGTDGVAVSVMEGDSVTLYTDVETNQQEKIRWYFNDTRIAQISGDLSKICTDVQCENSDERFRDRLKLDHQTGSLTITNITDTDAGVYQLKIISSSSDSEKIYNVTVHGVSAAERDKMKRKSVMEGESVTLYTGVMRELNDSITWYLNDIYIAEMTGDQSKICTDVQCKERFRDRLKLDHQTGSLIITNTRNTDSGEYTLLINSRFSIIRSFSVSVTAPPDAGLSSAAIGVICAAAVLLVAAAAVIYCLYRSKQKGNWTPPHDCDQKNDVREAVPLQPIDILQEGAANGTSTGQTDGPLTGADNEIPQ